MIPKHLEIAFGELGQAEVPGPGTNPRIALYLTGVGMAPSDEIPWCSAFVNAVIVRANHKGTNRANARSWLEWGVPTVPVLGAVCVLWRINPENPSGHVGFYLDQDSYGVYLLGGNQSDKVCIRRYPLERVLGYRVPATMPA